MSSIDKDNTGTDKVQEYTRYLDERRSLIDARFKVAESLDKALLTLSGGALAVSMTFIKDIVKNPVCKSTLVFSWIFFGLAITVLLLSLYFCQLAYIKQRQIIDHKQNGNPNKNSNKREGGDEVRERNVWSIVTEIANFTALASFLTGLVLLGTFIWANM